MRIREPVVAGQFYEADPDRCRADLEECLSKAGSVDLEGRRLIGGVVPHAGWTFSGALAAKVFRALADSRSPDVIVVFGSVHRHRGREAALFGDGRWEGPLGAVSVDRRLAERILSQTNLIVDDPYAHESEHSIEVQMPFIARLFPKAKVMPIMVPPVRTAPEVGQAVGRTLTSYDYDAVVVGTTDLTHYGPRYGFAPFGVGSKGNTWAKAKNDTRFIELVCAMRASEVVAEAGEHHNACGSGAVAATIAAAAALGATTGELLDHTTSAEVMAGRMYGDSGDSVGYAAIVFS